MINTNKLHYQAAASVNLLVATGKVILQKIIIGADVGSSVIEISDSVDDGDGNIKIKLSGSTLMTANGGEVLIGAVFENGIAADIVNQTDITFVWIETV